MTPASFAAVIHGAHRRLFVLCVTAQWLLGHSAMINSGGPQGRAARPGYSTRDLVSGCNEASGAEPGAEAGTGNLWTPVPKIER